MENNEISLKSGAYLQEYRIDRLLGSGGFGITYLATDTNLDKNVVIKEYLPNEIAFRQNSSMVLPKTNGDAENFRWGLDRFLQEAKTLAKFNHPNIVRINRFFEANNTAYFVMDFEDGVDLEVYLAKVNRRLSHDEILSLIMPVLDGLREVHAHNYLHRDIKPSNIFIRKNGSPVLIDFGASRFAIGSKSKSITQILTPGYAPIEQYSTDISKHGPFTDIYATGAVLYRLVTTKTPIESQDRSHAIIEGRPDPYTPLYPKYENYPKEMLKAIDLALSLKTTDRPQSAKELQELLMGMDTGKKSEAQPQTPPQTQYTPPQPSIHNQPEASSNNNKNKDIFIAIGVLTLLSYRSILYTKLYGKRARGAKETKGADRKQ